MIKLIKKKIKSNEKFLKFISKLIYIYLKLIYKTFSCVYIDHSNYKEKLNLSKKTIFIFWHNQLAIAPYFLLPIANTIAALTSPHTDGKIISNVLLLFGSQIIEGSSNKNSFVAARMIIKHLNNLGNVAIIPDGPRGPAYKINSNLLKIMNITNSQIVALSFKPSLFFCLNTWDKLVIPLPFSRLKISVAFPNKEDNLELYLNKLNDIKY